MFCHGEQKANSHKWEIWPQNVCCCCIYLNKSKFNNRITGNNAIIKLNSGQYSSVFS